MDHSIRGREGEPTSNIFGGATHSVSEHTGGRRSSNDRVGHLTADQPLGGPHRLVK
jgi:hypothetical protein